MTKESHAVILFYTSNHAFRAEKMLDQEGIPCKLIPVPRHLSSDCSVCARITRDQMEAARRILDAARVETLGIHEI
jgi:hypothetical protein